MSADFTSIQPTIVLLNMIGEKITDGAGLQYIIESEIGRGGFGVVYLAHGSDGQSYATKMIGPVSSSDLAESFKREVAAVSGIDHQNVLKFLGEGEHSYRGSRYFFTVAEYCPEGNYRSVLEKRGVSIQDTIVDFKQIIVGVGALHQKVIHRDIKPENILIAKRVLKVADLGLSKSIDEATRTLTFKGSGTPRYMAPEVWERKRVTPATDLYSIGVMLFESLTGEAPFTADDSAELRDLHLFKTPPRTKSLNPDVPDHIDGAVRKLLEKDPLNRYQTAAEVAAVFEMATQEKRSDALIGIASKMRRNYDIQQQKILETQRTANEALKIEKRNEYMERDLIELVDSVASEINEQLQEIKIERTNNAEENIYRAGGRSLHIGFFGPGRIYFGLKSEDLKKILRNHHVVHGGYISISEGREKREGWNIVLVRSSEDVYGKWIIIETEMSALVGQVFRYSPSATDALLLAENLAYHWMPAMHSYVLKDRDLTREDIIRIFDKLIP